MVPAVLMVTGSEFQQEEPEKDRLVLNRSIQGLGKTYLLGQLLLSLKERGYVGRCHPAIHLKHQYCLIEVQLFLQRQYVKGLNFFVC